MWLIITEFLFRKKQKEIIILNTNKNDVEIALGPPSTKSTFDNDVWIYMERKNNGK